MKCTYLSDSFLKKIFFFLDETLCVKEIKKMKFGANKMPIEVIKEGAFGGTYFGDIYSGINGKWSGTESHGKNLFSWKIFIKSIIAQIIMLV